MNNYIREPINGLTHLAGASFSLCRTPSDGY